MSQDYPTTAEKILDATERLLARYGYRKMTVDDIATETGIGKGTIYLSFKSKEEVVLSTVDRIVDRVCESMESIGRGGGDVMARLNDMLVARVLIRFESVSAYSESLNDLLSAVRPGLLQRRELHFEREAKVLTAVLREGQKRGAIVPGSPARMARTLILATNSLLPYSLSPKELGDIRQVRKDAAEIAGLLTRALTAAREPAISMEIEKRKAAQR
jgi:AcrR family transcriptional regulator